MSHTTVNNHNHHNNSNNDREETGSPEAGNHDVVERREGTMWQSIWANNKGALLILISELFGASMDAMAKHLQQSGAGFHTLQIIFARMGITCILSTLYMWWIQVPHFPLGHPDIRGWLVLRALFGFVGLFSLYYSVRYLPLAENTVFRFLIPLVTAWSCHVFLGQQFTRAQLTAAIVALVGVIIIAHPGVLFGYRDATIIGPESTKASPSLFSASSFVASSLPGDLDRVTPAQRLLAIGVSLVGVIGASGAYTFIRLVGGRAHALFSVNYFAFIATIGSALALLALPGAGGFLMPHSATEWALLLAMGVFGFVLQFLLTAGLQLDKSPKATAMLYAQVIFALGFDYGIWGVVPGGWSLVGGAIVVASTLWSALQKNAAPKEPTKRRVVDEETALLGAQTRESAARRDDARA